MFANLNDEALVGNFSGVDLFIDYDGGDGNDVVLFTGAGTAGDFDFDGDVDGRDFLTWQRNTSIGDLADWQANYGAGALSALNLSVPEPAGLVLVVSAVPLFKWASRRGRQRSKNKTTVGRKIGLPLRGNQGEN